MPKNTFFEMTLNKYAYLLFMIFALLLGGLSTLQAEAESEEMFEDLDVFDKEEAFELPDAVGTDLDDDALRFFLLTAHPTKQVYYYREGDAYRPIRAAFNTFGNVHRISPRPKLVLFKKVTQTVEGKVKVAYVPVFEINVERRPDLFAVFVPHVPGTAAGKVYGMRSIDFTKKHFPLNQVTFINTLPKPLAVALEGNRGVVQPGELLRASYKTGRKGAGYLKVALAIRGAEGDAKLLYNKRISVFKDERILAIPIADPWGREAVKVLTYRDAGQ